MVSNRTVRKKRRNHGRSLIFLSVTLVFFGIIIFSSGRSFLKIIQLSRTKETEEKARDSALAKQAQLKEEIVRLNDDSLYIEEIARREYGMIKPGEGVFNITLPDTVNRAERNDTRK